MDFHEQCVGPFADIPRAPLDFFVLIKILPILLEIQHMFDAPRPTDRLWAGFKKENIISRGRFNNLFAPNNEPLFFAGSGSRLLKSDSSGPEPPAASLLLLGSFERDMKRSVNKGIIVGDNTGNTRKDLAAIRKRPGCGRSEEKVSQGCVGLIRQV